MTEPSTRDLFEILVREHAEMLSVYLRSVSRDPAVVDDLFQETMLTAWRTMDRFDRSRPFGPWLRGIAARLALAHRRKSARGWLLCNEQTLEHLDCRLDALAARPGDTWDDKIRVLDECVEGLPGRYQQAVKLRYHAELPAAAVAKRLSITLETLKKRLQRGRARLADCLTRKLSLAEATS